MRPGILSVADHAFGLTQRDVDELRQIMARECGVALSQQEAWVRAIELLAFAKMLVESLGEEEPS